MQEDIGAVIVIRNDSNLLRIEVIFRSRRKCNKLLISNAEKEICQGQWERPAIAQQQIENHERQNQYCVDRGFKRRLSETDWSWRNRAYPLGMMIDRYWTHIQTATLQFSTLNDWYNVDLLWIQLKGFVYEILIQLSSKLIIPWLWSRTKHAVSWMLEMEN